MDEIFNSMGIETAKRIKLLIELSYLKKIEGNRSEFARKINIKTSDPDFNKIFNYLITKKIIVKVEGSLSAWDKYHIDVKKLCNLIESIPLVKKIREYISYPH